LTLAPLKAELSNSRHLSSKLFSIALAPSRFSGRLNSGTGVKRLSLVLVVGWYRELMLTRIGVLRSSGYAVTESYDLNEALRILRVKEIALVVICQSIPRKLVRALVRDIKRIKPSTPVLVFSTGIMEADASLVQLAGPEALLSSVAALVRGPDKD